VVLRAEKHNFQLQKNKIIKEKYNKNEIWYSKTISKLSPLAHKAGTKNNIIKY